MHASFRFSLPRSHCVKSPEKTNKFTVFLPQEGGRREEEDDREGSAVVGCAHQERSDRLDRESRQPKGRGRRRRQFGLLGGQNNSLENKETVARKRSFSLAPPDCSR